MSLDAIVWLIAGIGLGVGLSLFLLLIYSGLERLRLRRRIKRARVLNMTPEPRESRASLPEKPVAAVSMVSPRAGGKSRRVEPVVPETASVRALPLARNENAVKRAEPVAAPEPANTPEPAVALQPVASGKPSDPPEPEAAPEPAAVAEPEDKLTIKPEARSAPAPVATDEVPAKVEPAPAIETKPASSRRPAPRPAPIADVAAMNEVEGVASRRARFEPRVASKPAAARPVEAPKQEAFEAGVVSPEAPKVEDKKLPEPSKVEPPTVKPAPKSVEALFAEAFARDPLVKPGSGDKP